MLINWCEKLNTSTVLHCSLYLLKRKRRWVLMWTRQQASSRNLISVHFSSDPPCNTPVRLTCYPHMFNFAKSWSSASVLVETSGLYQALIAFADSLMNPPGDASLPPASVMQRLGAWATLRRTKMGQKVRSVRKAPRVCDDSWYLAVSHLFSGLSLSVLLQYRAQNKSQKRTKWQMYKRTSVRTYQDLVLRAITTSNQSLSKTRTVCFQTLSRHSRFQCYRNTFKAKI